MTIVDLIRAEYREIVRLEREKLEAFVARSDSRDVDSVLRESRLNSLDDVWAAEGDSPALVDEAREFWGGWLPASLEAYLLDFAKRSRFYYLDADCSASEILKGMERIETWREEVSSLPFYNNGVGFELPDSVLYFGHRQGEEFWFYFEKSNDPIVWRLLEGGVGEVKAGVRSFGLTFRELVIRDALTGPRWRIERGISGSARRRER